MGAEKDYEERARGKGARDLIPFLLGTKIFTTETAATAHWVSRWSFKKIHLFPPFLSRVYVPV